MNGTFFDWSACRACPEAEGCNPDCSLFSSVPFDELGGFVFEPGSASGLVRFPPPALISNLVRLIRNSGGLILVNEITTGMGRTGKWFGYNHYRFQPNLVAIGKGLGNGYPVSSLAISREAAELLEEKSFYYQQSHQNDALGCRVALAVVRELGKGDYINRSKLLGNRLLGKLQNLSLSYDQVKEVRGKGLMMAIEFNGKGDHPAAAIHNGLFKKGYIASLRRGYNSLRIDPPLIIDEAHLGNFARELEASLKGIS